MTTKFTNIFLIQLHFLGYPTHFGQLECMKLTASPHFPEKRIGYLGMMLLLSEEADVLMLATNSLKNDLNSQNKFVAGLALCAIGNLATADMSRDLAPEVDKHLKSPMPYLRKKANLAMVRCLAKCPDMVEDFVDRVVSLLKDKSHGVLITVVQLMTQVLMIDFHNSQEEGEDPFSTPCRTAFLRLVPTLVKMLRNLLSSGFSPDHDVGGISDPFLQVQILTLLRLLGANNEKASEEMNDVLAQVATNTETSKNAGNAILYECVQTIMGVESEDGLRVLAVNILGRFLLNRDNNIRYVALNTLSRCIVEQKQTGRELIATDGESGNSAFSALQRHRQTVVDCLKDPDISIRMRALELIYHLVNQDNVETLAGELLNYLVLCPREHRADICSRILRVVERFSPNDRWRVDSLITMLTIAGRDSTRDVQSACAVYISRASEDIHAYATHKLLKAIRDDDGTQRGLLSVGIWSVGEYGDLLLAPYSYTAPPEVGQDGMDTIQSPVTITFMELSPIMVVNTVEEVINRVSCPLDVKQRALTCFAKLSERYADKGDHEALQKLQTLIKKHESSHSLELQLRSCEYDALINAAKGIAPAPRASPDDIFGVEGGSGGGSVGAGVVQAAKEALARMPMVDLKVLQKKQATSESFGADGESVSRAPAAAPAKSGGGDLLDFDMLGGGDSGAQPQQNGGGGLFDSKPSGGGEKSDMDLLSEIFSAQPAPAPAAGATAGGYDPFSAPAPAQASAPAPVNPMDLFGSSPVPAPAAQSSSMDLFGGPPAQTQQSQAAPVDPFGASPAPSMGNASQPDTVTVQGPSHGGISIEFECSKPDSWDKQKSTLVAKFTNTTNEPVVGLNLQVAVPKYVTLEMQPPTSTTVPPSGNNNMQVTQTIKVSNSMLGTKNLMLKLKLGFTAKGQKIEHMATQSGFPAGQY